MAVLTWQNINTPIGTGGNAITDATSAFSNAMSSLREASDRARANRRTNYSTEALMGLAAIENPEEVGAYIQSRDPELMNSDALQVMMSHPELLLDRATKKIGLQDAEADLRYQEGDRSGKLSAGAALAQGIFNAQSNGELLNPADALAANPYASPYLASGLSNVAEGQNHYYKTMDAATERQIAAENRAGTLEGNRLAYDAAINAQATGVVPELGDIVPENETAYAPLLEHYAKLGSGQDQFVSNADSVFDYNTKVEGKNVTDSAEETYQQLTKEGFDTKHASYLADNLDLDPKVRAAVGKLITDGGDSAFQNQDILAPTSLMREDQSLMDAFTANQHATTSLVEKTDDELAGIEGLTYLDMIDELNLTDTQAQGQGLADRLTELGVTDPGTDYEGLNSFIGNIQNRMVLPENGGIKPTRAEVAAAIMATSRASKVAFDDTLKAGKPQAIMDLIRNTARDRDSLVVTRDTARAEAEKASEYITQIAEADRNAAIAMGANKPEIAQQFADASRALVAEQSEYLAGVANRREALKPPPPPGPNSNVNADGTPKKRAPADEMVRAYQQNERDQMAINERLAPQAQRIMELPMERRMNAIRSLRLPPEQMEQLINMAIPS